MYHLHRTNQSIEHPALVSFWAAVSQKLRLKMDSTADTVDYVTPGPEVSLNGFHTSREFINST